jgi:hypothetical protein
MIDTGLSLFVCVLGERLKRFLVFHAPSLRRSRSRSRAVDFKLHHYQTLTLVNSRETDLNATRSAITAGYSKKTAELAASRLLRNVKVSAEVANDPRKQHGNGAKAPISEAYARSGRLQASGVERARGPC